MRVSVRYAVGIHAGESYSTEYTDTPAEAMQRCMDARLSGATTATWEMQVALDNVCSRCGKRTERWVAESLAESQPFTRVDCTTHRRKRRPLPSGPRTRYSPVNR